MSKKNEEIIQEVEEVEEIEDKKSKKDSVEKRKKAKKKDAIERFSGLIFLFLIVLVGLLLWVGSEVSNAPKGMQVPTTQGEYSRVIVE